MSFVVVIQCKTRLENFSFFCTNRSVKKLSIMYEKKSLKKKRQDCLYIQI